MIASGAARRLLAAALGFAPLAGCVVGPKYAGPPVVAPRAAGASAFTRSGDAPFVPSPGLARWWEALGDATLTRIEDDALAANPDLAIAEAKLREARAGLREQKADLHPRTTATALYAHARFPGLNLENNDGTQDGEDGENDSGGGGSSAINLYNLGFDATWEIDLFGGQHRAIESARAIAKGAEADLADAQVSLTAEVAQAYVNARDRQARIALNGESSALLEKILALTRQRLARGTASRVDVAATARQLDETRADAMPLGAELDAYLDELATLTGKEPGALDQAMATPAPIPLPPARVEIGDPADLIRHRPDIRSAERALAADTAGIGQAKAARFPSLSFIGILGIGGTAPADLTRLDDYTALVAPQLSWSFLDFGRTAAKVRRAEAVRDEADARYRKAVLGALRDAEDSLSRFRTRRTVVAELARADAAAETALALSRQRYAAGTVTLIDVLDLRRQRLAAARGLTMATAALTGDFVAIQKALGAGWSGSDGQDPAAQVSARAIAPSPATGR